MIFCSSCDDSLYHSILHGITSSLSILPFLFITYLIIEIINKKYSKKTIELFSKSKLGPLLGSLVGIIPQCGFSSTISTLYINKIVSIGTLFAVLIATSDEAMIILISNKMFLDLLVLIITKFILALVIGSVIDLIIKKKTEQTEVEIETSCCSYCKKENSIIKNVVIHTLQIFLFVLITSVFLEIVIHLIGKDNLESILLKGSIFQPILASLIGLIPNCASSVLLTNLYVSGSLTFSSLLAGLICNGGIGLLILFKTKKDIKQSLLILISLFSIAITVGIILEIISLI